MIHDYFTDAEIAEELGIDVGMVKELIDGRAEWKTDDVDKLLDKLAAKLGHSKK